MSRVATSDDLSAVLALEAVCFGTGAWSDSLILASIADPHQEVVVTVGGEAYGVIRMSGDSADLDRIAVLPAARRHGVGRNLLDDLVSRAVQRGADRMLLEVAVDNAAATALYERAGFVPIHRRRGYYAGGVDAIVMQRLLADSVARDRVGS